MSSEEPLRDEGLDGGKGPDGAPSLFIGRTDARSNAMSYEKEEDERNEINRDHVVVRGC